MARAIWTGSIGFGLVNIPVRLYNATVPLTVRFHEFDRTTGRRIQHRRMVEPEPMEPWWPSAGEPAVQGPRAPEAASGRPEEAPPVQSVPAGEEPMIPAQADGRPEVAYDDVIKGYEVEPGRFVMLTPEELRELRPERSRTIEIQEFVSLDDIDPVYFDRTYYLSPGRGAGAEKPYSLLLRAMQRSRRVGIGSFVLTSRLHLAAIRPREDVLVLETLFYGDEVRSVAEIDAPISVVDPSSRELDVAVRLVELLSGTWDPSRYQDQYRQRVLELIGSKAPETVAVAEPLPGAEPSAGVADLMAALQASVQAARKSARKDATRRSRPRRTG